MRTRAITSTGARPSTSVQQTLGHDSVATTGHYLHARLTDSSARYLGVSTGRQSGAHRPASGLLWTALRESVRFSQGDRQKQAASCQAGAMPPTFRRLLALAAAFASLTLGE